MSQLFYQDLLRYPDSDILKLAKMYKLQGSPRDLRLQIATKHSQRAEMLPVGRYEQALILENMDNDTLKAYCRTEKGVGEICEEEFKRRAKELFPTVKKLATWQETFDYLNHFNSELKEALDKFAELELVNTPIEELIDLNALSILSELVKLSKEQLIELNNGLSAVIDSCLVTEFLIDNFDVINSDLDISFCSNRVLKKIVEKTNDAKVLENVYYRFAKKSQNDEMIKIINKMDAEYWKDFFQKSLVSGNTEVIKYLINKGFKPTVNDDADDRYAQSDINYAIYLGNKDIIKILLDTLDEKEELYVPDDIEIIDLILPYAKNVKELQEKRKLLSSGEKITALVDAGDLNGFRELLENFEYDGDKLIEHINYIIEQDANPMFLVMIMKHGNYSPEALKELLSEIYM